MRPAVVTEHSKRPSSGISARREQAEPYGLRLEARGVLEGIRRLRIWPAEPFGERVEILPADSADRVEVGQGGHEFPVEDILDEERVPVRRLVRPGDPVERVSAFRVAEAMDLLGERVGPFPRAQLDPPYPFELDQLINNRERRRVAARDHLRPDTERVDRRPHRDETCDRPLVEVAGAHDPDLSTLVGVEPSTRLTAECIEVAAVD